MSAPRVLIVEDEFLIRLTLAEALTDEGFEVVEAANAQDAWPEVERADLALLLTDIHLPGGVNGLELARRALASNPGLSVIYMTGRPDSMADHPSSDRELFIAKPYLPSEVCAAARRLVGKTPQ